MKTYCEEEVQLHAFLISALDGMNSQVHAPAALLPGKELPGPNNNLWIFNNAVSIAEVS
jgi:hypothetical protein